MIMSNEFFEDIQSDEDPMCDYLFELESDEDYQLYLLENGLGDDYEGTYDELNFDDDVPF
jgi:hypothetical protein